MDEKWRRRKIFFRYLNGEAKVLFYLEQEV